MISRCILSLAVVILIALPSLAVEPDSDTVVKSFEERYGFRNVFWCAENADLAHGTLTKVALEGRSVPGIAFLAPPYCQERHFATTNQGDCEQSLDALYTLDKMYDGFLRGEFARDIMSLCQTYVKR